MARRRARNSAGYEPKKEWPLAAIGIAGAGFSIQQLLSVGDWVAEGSAGAIALLAAFMIVLLVIRHWRHG